MLFFLEQHTYTKDQYTITSIKLNIHKDKYTITITELNIHKRYVTLLQFTKMIK